MRRIILAAICLLIAAICLWQTGLKLNGFDRQSISTVIDSGAGDARLSSSIVTGQTSNKAGAEFPSLSGRVVDTASMLSSAEKSDLENKLAVFEAKSSDQVVVATLTSLNRENLEDYTNRLFRHWQLGQAKENNGVLLLVARDDRKLRIEVGYGLEGILTDAISNVIINQVIVPRFKEGNFGPGIVEGADMIMRVLSGDVAELEARKDRNNQQDSDVGDIVIWIFLLIWAVCFFGPFGFALLAPIFGKKIGKKRYRWLGIEIAYSSSRGGGWSSGSSSGGWSGGSSGGGFSGGGGSSGGGGASGGW